MLLEPDTGETFEGRISIKIEEMEEKIAGQDQRLGAFVEKLKTEMMKKMEDMFAAQNEKILQQDRKIAEQDETIVAFAFARQPCKSPVCDASPTLPEESHLYITGGHSGSNRLSSTEIYPPLLPGCSPPSLPATTSGHSTFVTSEPDALVANCGGFAGSARTASCNVLDPVTQRWDESRMGSLTMERGYAAVARLNHIGVFIVGGAYNNNGRTSEFLAAKTMHWQEGPALPVAMTHPCAVTITQRSFLSIQGTDIREFDAALAGPTSTEGWREAGRWPRLKTSREYNPGCAKVGQKVIIAGKRGGTKKKKCLLGLLHLLYIAFLYISVI